MSTRTLIGSIRNGKFIPMMRDLPELKVPKNLLPSNSDNNNFWATVGLDDDADFQLGPIIKIEQAGPTIRTTKDLLASLNDLSEK